MRASLKFLVVPAAVGLLYVAGCGGGSSGTTSAPTQTSAGTTTSAPTQTSAQTTTSGAQTSAGTTLQLTADPTGSLDFVQTKLTAPPGKVTINLTNNSPLGHDVVVENASGKEVAHTPVFTGGSRSTEFTATPGTYTYHCSVPGHTSMKGTLTVQ